MKKTLLLLIIIFASLSAIAQEKWTKVVDKPLFFGTETGGINKQTKLPQGKGTLTFRKKAENSKDFFIKGYFDDRKVDVEDMKLTQYIHYTGELRYVVTEGVNNTINVGITFRKGTLTLNGHKIAISTDYGQFEISESADTKETDPRLTYIPSSNLDVDNDIAIKLGQTADYYGKVQLSVKECTPANIVLGVTFTEGDFHHSDLTFNNTKPLGPWTLKMPSDGTFYTIQEMTPLKLSTVVDEAKSIKTEDLDDSYKNLKQIFKGEDAVWSSTAHKTFTLEIDPYSKNFNSTLSDTKFEDLTTTVLGSTCILQGNKQLHLKYAGSPHPKDKYNIQAQEIEHNFDFDVETMKIKRGLWVSKRVNQTGESSESQSAKFENDTIYRFDGTKFADVQWPELSVQNLLFASPEARLYTEGQSESFPFNATYIHATGIAEKLNSVWPGQPPFFINSRFGEKAVAEAAATPATPTKTTPQPTPKVQQATVQQQQPVQQQEQDNSTEFKAGDYGIKLEVGDTDSTGSAELSVTIVNRSKTDAYIAVGVAGLDIDVESKTMEIPVGCSETLYTYINAITASGQRKVRVDIDNNTYSCSVYVSAHASHGSGKRTTSRRKR